MTTSSLSNLTQQLQQHIVNYLEEKTHRRFSIGQEHDYDVAVRGLWDLINLYLSRNIDSYKSLYLKGAFETPFLRELLYVLPYKKVFQPDSNVYENIADLYYQPKVFLPFLFSNDLDFIGFYPNKHGCDHLSFIADIMEINPFDTVLELGFSAGHASVFMTKKYQCQMYSGFLSQSHQQMLQGSINIHHEKDYISIINFKKIAEISDINFNKVVINSFFELWSEHSLRKLFNTLKPVVNRDASVMFYIQGLFSPDHIRVLKSIFGYNPVKKTYYLQDCAMKVLQQKEESLYQYQETMSQSFYRAWRLYFIDKELAISRWGYVPLGLFLEIRV